MTDRVTATRRFAGVARPPWVVVVLWLFTVVSSIAGRWSRIADLTFSGPDDATRFVQIRALLDGQGWWDLRLDRIGVAGVEMHWSRHVDAPVALVAAVMEPLVGRVVAEQVAIVVVPAALLLGVLWIAHSIAGRLSVSKDAGLYAVLSVALAVGLLPRFMPGALDHHGLQIFLILVVARAAIATQTATAGAIIGIAAGLSMTVGLETLPLLAGIIGAVAVSWVFGKEQSVGFIRALALWLVSSALLSSLLFAPPGRLVSLECDVFSAPFFVLIAAPALILALATTRERAPAVRLLVLLIGTGIGVAGFITLNPACLDGPYAALSVKAQEVWLSRIAEVQGVAGILQSRPLFGIGLVMGPLAGLGFAFASRKLRQRPWPLIGGLLVGLVVSLWQVRVVPLLGALSAPLIGAMAVAVRDSYRSTIARALAGLTLVLVLSGAATTYVQGLIPAEEGTSVAGCLDDQIVSQLSAQQPGLVLADVDLAPMVLVRTDHRVLAASYHRSYEDILLAYTVLAGDKEEAENLAKRIGVDYILVCRGTAWSAEWSGDNPSGLLADLIEGERPGWLDVIFESDRAILLSVRS